MVWKWSTHQQRNRGKKPNKKQSNTPRHSVHNRADVCNQMATCKQQDKNCLPWR